MKFANFDEMDERTVELCNFSYLNMQRVVVIFLMLCSGVQPARNSKGVFRVKQLEDRFAFLQTKTQKPGPSRKFKSDDFFEDFRRFNETIKYIKELRKRLPAGAAKVFSIGKSIEGRSLTIIQIGSKSKPGIWIDGGIHAREWISVATVTYIAGKVIDEFHDKTSFIREFCWYILPVLNPDGYEYSHTKDRVWRKNRNLKNRTCPGVDLNRNWGYHWNEKGSSEDPCDDQYSGEKAFSEPETRAVSDFLLRKIKKQKFIAYLSFHSFGQAWVYPWGWTTKTTSDFHDLAIVAIKAVTALSKVNNTIYEVGQASKLAGVASGGSADWAKGVAGIKYSYTVELPDAGFYGFLLPKKFIPHVGKEMWEGIKELANVISKLEFTNT